MTKINLLPWREERRKQRQKDFINAMELSALIGILVVGLIHTSIQGLKAYQGQRNQLLQNEIILLDKKIIEIRDIFVLQRLLLRRYRSAEASFPCPFSYTQVLVSWRRSRNQAVNAVGC